MKIIRRDDIPSLHTVSLDGAKHSLGTVRIFIENRDFATLLPRNSESAFSWVHLGPGEELTPHQHDESSLILICEGSGYVIGSLNKTLCAGDAVFVSPNDLHGFRGGESGFWGLSIQFSGHALYEDRDAPRVRFHSVDSRQGGVAELIALNGQYLEEFRSSKLMRLVSDGSLKDESVRERLLDALQGWSDAFQTLLHLRIAHSQNLQHKKAALAHLLEEHGHNDNLRRQRQRDTPPMWDATIATAAAWFGEKMRIAPDVVKTMIMHMVIEASGELFHAAAAEVFTEFPHFQEHGEDDGGHVDLGVALIQDSATVLEIGLASELDMAWNVMLVLCDRMAELSLAAGRGQITQRIERIAAEICAA